jgi:hypothetical protein
MKRVPLKLVLCQYRTFFKSGLAIHCIRKDLLIGVHVRSGVGIMLHKLLYPLAWTNNQQSKAGIHRKGVIKEELCCNSIVALVGK